MQILNRNYWMLAVAVHALSFQTGPPARGQGLVNLANRTAWVDAPVYDLEVGGLRLEGTNFLAQLYGARAGSSETNLRPVGPVVSFDSGALSGYFTTTNAVRAIPGVPAGSGALMQVRVWTAASGATYEAAVTRAAATRSPQDRFGKSTLMITATGVLLREAPPWASADLAALESFGIAPWPGWPTPEQANLVTNGSFALAETTWWAGDVHQGGWVGGGGNAGIYLQGIIYQDLPTSPGRVFLLSFAAGGTCCPDTPCDSGKLSVYWDTNLLGSFKLVSDTHPQFLVEASRSPTRLRFEGGCYPALDDVRVALAPTDQPRVEVLAPTNDSQFVMGDNIQLAASPVAGPGRRLTQVDFLEAGVRLLGTATTPPWTTLWSNTPPGVYYFSARVTDNAGSNTWSSAVRVVVHTRPLVWLYGPLSGAVLTAGADAMIRAGLTNNDGSITRLEILVERNLLASVAVSGDTVYAVPWPNLAPGNYTISVLGKDTEGRVKDSLEAVVHVMAEAVLDQNQPQAPRITGAVQDWAVAQTFTPQIEGRLHHVTVGFGAYDAYRGEPVECQIRDAAGGMPGTHILAASVVAGVPYEAMGNTYYFAPEGQFYFPSNKVYLRAGQPHAIVLKSSAVTSLIAGATPDDTYAGGQSWHQFPGESWKPGVPDFLPSTNGDLAFFVYMIPPTPPAVNLFSPVDGARFDRNPSIVLSAAATDADDEVIRIGFYLEDALLAEGPGSLFTCVWSNAPLGNWIITARATDEHGRVGTAAAAILVGPDNGLPHLTVSDVLAFEGPPGTSNAVFTFVLSAPSADPVTVDYATADGTAHAPADYVATSGTVTFPPGATTVSLAVPIQDDALDEKDESFYLWLRRPVNAILLRAKASGVIVDDEFGPGELHHFAWAPVPSSVLAGQQFPVRLEAKDLFNTTVSNFVGSVHLGLATNVGANLTLLGSTEARPLTDLGYTTAGYLFTPHTNMQVTALRAYYGTKLSLWTGDGTFLAYTEVTTSQGAWADTVLTPPQQLYAHQQYRLYCYSGGRAICGRQDGSNGFAHGTIDGAFVNGGETYETNASDIRWPAVDLRYSVQVPLPDGVQPATIAAFADGVWTGAVAVLTAGTNLRLHADDARGRAGDSGALQVTPATDLAVSVFSSSDLITQGDSMMFTVGVSNAGPCTAHGVAIRSSLPRDVPLLAVLASQGTVSNAPTYLRWNLGTLGVGTFATLQLSISPTSYGTITCTAAVTALTETNLKPANDQARMTMTVNGRPIAEAGSDQTVECTGLLTSVRLDGSASRDVDSDALSFSWREEGTVLGTGAILDVPLSLGNHTVGLEVTDARGGRAVDTVLIAVVDTSPPEIVCSAPLTAECTSASGTAVFFEASARDLCDGIIPVRCAPEPGARFAAGTTVVHCVSRDGSGHSNACSFTVTVLDRTPPRLVCPTNLFVEFTSENGAPVEFEPEASDDCSAVTVVCSPPSGSTLAIGSTDVISTATDGSGNAASCHFQVTVLGARGVKENVLADLSALQAALTNRAEGDKLRLAIERLSEALEPGRWLDQTHVHPKNGEGVFNLEKDSLLPLLQELEDPRNPVPAEAWRDFIRRLIQCDRLLATVAIRRASQAGGDPAQIDKAWDEVSKGDADAQNSKVVTAVEHYRNAWRHSSHLSVRESKPTAGRLGLTFYGSPGQVYAIQASTNLLDWVTMATRRADVNGVLEFEVSIASACPTGFYRIKAP